jgi:hypothetical protein
MLRVDGQRSFGFAKQKSCDTALQGSVAREAEYPICTFA